MTWYTPWWAEIGSASVGCRCTEEGSWTRATDGTWIHSCGYPSEATLRSQDMLNIFRGGPRHNELYETSQLTTDRSIASWITSYRWTPDVIVGSISGREARVWTWKDESTSTDSSIPEQV